jgi:hypothetical protein
MAAAKKGMRMVSNQPGVTFRISDIMEKGSPP